MGESGGLPGTDARFPLLNDSELFLSEILTRHLPYRSHRHTSADHAPADRTLDGNMATVSRWHDAAGAMPSIALAIEGNSRVANIPWQPLSQPVG
ncbi:hypothetical protein OHA84_35255 [Streptomyces sp. NBC_00513]|uniref:hypothetical protein n=1 Tax=unclassified Streptomyces TaxID=2593676 RepID=UPI00225B0F17|nr:hypothetical protein [Streptomyces sp. NBC_00424]MCX5071223.1 hypothetical protein [Streptomyces sp. NBC_00424]WUD45360.1 hypothetical protein OHA84_35255 [Streptomyces sp. NBC_00513]